MAVTMTDYLVVNIGGTPGTAGTGTYYVSSIGGILQAGSGIAASADPATLTAWEGDIVWFGGEPYAWDGTGYVQLTTGPHPISYQVAAAAPANRDDGSAHQEGDLWFDTANDALMAYDGAAWNGVGGAAGGNSTLVDNGDNTVTHTSGSGATFTFLKAPTHTASPAAPAAAFVGDTWWDTVNDTLHKRINDGTTDAWVQISTSAATSANQFDWQSGAADPNGVVTTQADGTSALVDGDQFWDGTNDNLYAWDGSAWKLLNGGGSSTTILATDAIAGSNSDVTSNFIAQTSPAPAGTTRAKIWGVIDSDGAASSASVHYGTGVPYTTIKQSTGAAEAFYVDIPFAPGQHVRLAGGRGSGQAFVEFY